MPVLRQQVGRMQFEQYNRAHRTQILEYATAYRTGWTSEPTPWYHFASFNELLYSKLDLRIEFTYGIPYRSQVELARDVARKQLYVTKDNVTHPVWSDTQNLQFRAVHDWHHIQSGGKFTWPGDILTCQSHLDALVHIGARRDSMMAVFDSECFGQNATAIVVGEFPTQRIVEITGSVLS